MENSALVIVLHRLRTPFLVLLISYSISIIGLVMIDGVDNNGNIYHLSIFDAFYFVTYTATTIGFGESPYVFTYSQKIWVAFMIYLVVLGWFYSIGNIIGLIQDKQFLIELARGKFKKQIKALNQSYIIVLGYNYATKQIIERALENHFRVVVIEKDEDRVNMLKLENFTPVVPVLLEDAHNSLALEQAGVRSIYCKAVVSLFNDNNLNLRVSLATKILNKHVKIATKSTVEFHTEHLKTIGIEVIKNPFEINAFHIKTAITRPNILRVDRWLQGLGALSAPIVHFPKGEYIICGYGSLGKHMQNALAPLDITLTFIDENKNSNISKQEIKDNNIIIGNADNAEVLLKAGIKNANAIIIGTNDDTYNLSVLVVAQKINPNIITIVRENELNDFSVFQSADIDYIFMPTRTLINQITNAILNPLTDRFNKHIYNKPETWGSSLVANLIKNINENPIIYKLTINKDTTPELYEAIKNKIDIRLSLLRTSLRDKKKHNNIIPLFLYTHDKKEVLLPSFDQKINIDDEILFALDSNAKDDLECIAQNMYEFEYVTGMGSYKRLNTA